MSSSFTTSFVACCLPVMLIGCAMEAQDPNVTNADQALSSVISDDFENYPTGTLGAPWALSGGGASVVNVETTSDHGKVAALRGSTRSGDFVSAVLGFSVHDARLRVELAIKPAAGAAFVFGVRGAGPSLGARNFRLQRNPGSDALLATTNSGNLECGRLSSGVWSKVTLELRSDTHDFDVSINGAQPAVGQPSPALRRRSRT